jgi:hypothetical protein
MIKEVTSADRLVGLLYSVTLLPASVIGGMFAFAVSTFGMFALSILYFVILIVYWIFA